MAEYTTKNIHQFSAWKPRLSEELIEEMAMSASHERYYGKLFQRMNRSLNRRSFDQLFSCDLVQYVPQTEAATDSQVFGEPKLIEFNPNAIPHLVNELQERIDRLQSVKKSLLYHQSVLREVIEQR